MKANFPIEQFRKLELHFIIMIQICSVKLWTKIKEEAGKYNKFCVHYAVKANANPKCWGIIRESGLGAIAWVEEKSKRPSKPVSQPARLYMPE